MNFENDYEALVAEVLADPVARAAYEKNRAEREGGGMPASGPPDPDPTAPRNRHQRRREKSPRWQRRTALDKARQK